jgi:TatD DNase family protein
MLTDAHCHPFDLIRVFPQAEQDRRRLGILAAASACDLEEFTHNEKLAQKAAAEKAAPLLPCFAVHPQWPAVSGERENKLEEQLSLLDELASQGRIAAVGECGFDLFNDAFKETEAVQDRIFAAHIEIAQQYDLPLVIHVRRATHKIFALSKNLAKCRSVIFHSWPSPFEEGQALLRRGVNAYFSFGNAVLNGHKQSRRSLSLFPADRLLTETDAPFQPARGENFSQWSDLPRVIEAASSLRGENAKELEFQIEANFRAAFAV